MNVSNIKQRATREEEWRCLAPPVIFIVDGADAVVTFVMRSKASWNMFVPPPARQATNAINQHGHQLMGDGCVVASNTAQSQRNET